MTTQRSEDYLQEVWDSLEPTWDNSKFDMKLDYDSEYGCECITITSKDAEGVFAKIYVNDYEGQHPVGFDVVYRYPGDNGVGVVGSYEFQSTDMNGLGEEVFDYFDELKTTVGVSKQSEAAEVKDKQYYLDMFDKAYKECVQLDIDDGGDGQDWADYFALGGGDPTTFSQKEADEIVGYYMEFHPNGEGETDRPYKDWMESIDNTPKTALDKEITRILKALYAPNESKKYGDNDGKFTIMPKDTSRKQAGIKDYQTRLSKMGFSPNLHYNDDYTHDYVKEIGKIPGATVYVGTINYFQKNTQEYQYEAELYMETEKGIRSTIEYMPFAITDISDGTQRKMYFNRFNALIKKGTDFVNNYELSESCKKYESLTLKQKELKDMVRLGEAEDITNISDAEAKELKKKGIETIGVSRGTYGMNGALLRDSDGKKYAILARNGNLFYFV